MVDPEIQNAIDIIDRKIKSLQNARDQLALAFGIEPEKPMQYTLARAVLPPFGTQPKRKQMMSDFLRLNGPMSRAEITSKSGMPEGTVSYCLSDKTYFRQLPNGDWTVAEATANGDATSEETEGAYALTD